MNLDFLANWSQIVGTLWQILIGPTLAALVKLLWDRRNDRKKQQQTDNRVAHLEESLERVENDYRRAMKLLNENQEERKEERKYFEGKIRDIEKKLQEAQREKEGLGREVAQVRGQSQKDASRIRELEDQLLAKDRDIEQLKLEKDREIAQLKDENRSLRVRVERLEHSTGELR